jgi:protein-disulfide isomerase
MTAKPLAVLFLLAAAACDGPAHTSVMPRAEAAVGPESPPPERCPTQNCAAAEPADTSPASAAALAVRTSPARGSPQAPVTLVEFSDFQCPFCARAAQTVQALQQHYGDRLRVVYKNAPLPFHAHAREAAAAALAAQEQGKFWEYHDLIFSHPGALDRAALESYATALNLDLRQALDSGRFEAAIDADQEQARQAGVQGTPAFFVNGRRIVGAQPLQIFTGAIDEELAKKGG